MMRFIVGSSLKFRFLAIAIAAGMLYFGIGQLRNMPVDVFPEFAPPRVEVQTISLGLSPEEVEALVTVPLEEAFNGLPGLDILRSKSVPQLSSIQMIFEPGTDLLEARQMVQERVALATPGLPTWAAPPIMLQPLSSTSRCLKIGISSKTKSVIDLSMITYWTINQRLLRVPGVANVAIWGERIEMLQVNVVPELLKKHNVTLEEVKDAVGSSLDVGLLQFSSGHIIGTGGWVDTPNQRMPVRHVLPIVYKSDEVTPDQLANVVLRSENGETLLMKDVAEVVIGHQPMVGEGIVNDGVGLLLIVEKFPWANTLEVTRGVEEALDALRPGLPDVEIDSKIFRPATFIEMSVDNLNSALLIAAILVIMVLFAFLYEWRVALISCTAIPLSLMAAMMVLFWRGTTINTMVLAGLVIALGAVVDDCRCRKCGAAIAPASQRRQKDLDWKSHSRSFDGSATRYCVCHPDRSHGAGAGFRYGRPIGCVLPPTRNVLCTRSIGFDGCRFDGNTGDELYPAAQCTIGKARITAGALAARHLCNTAQANCQFTAPGLSDCGGDRSARHPGGTAARPVFAARF